MRLFSILCIAIIGLTGCRSTLNLDSSYRIVVAEDADSLTRRAATELQRYFVLLDGVEREIVTDATPKNINEIRVGHTNRTDTTTGNFAALGADGFHIYTDGEALQILGGTNKGNLYGVYTLLDEYLGCRLYSAKVEVIPAVSSIEVPSVIDNRQIPVITFRDIHYRCTNDQKYIDWHRLSHDTTGNKPEWGLWVHTFTRLVPPAEHFAKHPEYYSLINGNRATTQLCLSNPAVLDILCENLAKEMALKPEAHYWSVSSDDNFGYCQCPLCAAADSLDGSATGSVIQFVNKVAARFPDKVISTLAYQYSRAAPKVTKPADNVNIMFCNIECNRSKPIATDPSSESFRKDMENWAKLTDNILVWDYVVQFKNLVSPFPNFHTLQPNLKFFVDNSVVAMFEQGNREVGGEFCDLRSYLLSKLAWNPYASTDSLIWDFCNGYYGEGGGFVKEYIDSITSKIIASDASMSIFGSPCNAAQTYLSPENLDLYNAIFDKAEAATAADNATLQRVKIARQPLLYAYLEQTKLDPYGPQGLYQKDANDKWVANPKYSQTLNSFIDLCKTEGVTRLSEWHTTPSEYLKMMGEVAVIRNEGMSFEKPIAISPVPHPKYAVKANEILSNGIRGTNDYTLQWLGWNTPTVQLTMDLGKDETISSASVRCLQNLGDWILLPHKVDFSVSNNGTDFRHIGTFAHAEDRATSVTAVEYNVTANTSARYVRADITGYGTCPSWHLGAGGNAFIFADEFTVD